LGLKNISESICDSNTTFGYNIAEKYIPFKEKYDIEKRRLWLNEALCKFPSKVPIIVELHSKEKTIHPIQYNPKFLIPKIFSIGDLMTVIRNKLHFD